jgi:Uma2 family endonuclease
MEIIIEKKKATAEDFKKLPEGAPFQLIGGQLVKEPSPQYFHQDTVAAIFSKMRLYTDENDLGKTLIAPFDVHFDEENIFQPDILFVSKENKNCRIEDWVYGPPDLIIEVLSEFNSYFDTKKKFKVYEKYGVKEYFIVDPNDKEVIAYYLHDNHFKETYKQAGIIKSQVLGGKFKF